MIHTLLPSALLRTGFTPTSSLRVDPLRGALWNRSQHDWLRSAGLDPMLQHGEVDALDQAIDLLKSVVLPALQERVLDNCDDDTQGDFRGREAQSKDDEFPTVKRRRRSHSTPPPLPRPSQSTTRPSQ